MGKLGAFKLAQPCPLVEFIRPISGCGTISDGLLVPGTTSTTRLDHLSPRIAINVS